MGCDCSFIDYNYREEKPLDKMINKKVNSITEFVDYVKNLVRFKTNEEFYKKLLLASKFVKN